MIMWKMMMMVMVMMMMMMMRTHDDGDDDDDDDGGVKNCDDVDDKGENDEIATKTSLLGLTLTTSRSGTR